MDASAFGSSHGLSPQLWTEQNDKAMAPQNTPRLLGESDRTVSHQPTNTESLLEDARQSMAGMEAAVSAFASPTPSPPARPRGPSPGHPKASSRSSGSRHPSPTARMRSRRSASQDGAPVLLASSSSRGPSPDGRRSSSAGKRRPRKRQSRERSGDTWGDEAGRLATSAQHANGQARQENQTLVLQGQSLQSPPAAPEFPLPDPPSAMCTRPSSPDAHQHPTRQSTTAGAPPPALQDASQEQASSGSGGGGSQHIQDSSRLLESSLAHAIDFEELEKEAEKAEIAALKVPPPPPLLHTHPHTLPTPSAWPRPQSHQCT